MSTSQQFLVCDSSTLANFKQWAQAISAFFTTATWTQSTDTGQVNWSTIVSVPGSSAFVYEIWQPNDGLTTFYVKMEYGNISGTNCPSLRITISTATNGSGTPTGFVYGPVNVNQTSFTPPSTITTYECNLSGAAGRIGVMMWRNAPANQGQEFFAIERSINSGGTYTSSYVTLWTAGAVGGTARLATQGSVVFGVGVASVNLNASNTSAGGWCNRVVYVAATTAFNGSIPFDTCSPIVGYFDYQCTVCGSAYAPDITEGVTFTATMYGATRTYLPSKIGGWSQCGPFGSADNTFAAALCMRYD
jgi:hypothetical protein